MTTDGSFKDYVVSEVLREVPGIAARAMFGGWGLYQDDIFFALIADGVLYFKVDESTKQKFEDYGSKPFVYSSAKGNMTMSYYELPSSVMEDSQEVISWVHESYEIAKKGKQKRKK